MADEPFVPPISEAQLRRLEVDIGVRLPVQRRVTFKHVAVRRGEAIGLHPTEQVMSVDYDGEGEWFYVIVMTEDIDGDGTNAKSED
jgi:hypothetical protein